MAIIGIILIIAALISIIISFIIFCDSYGSKEKNCLLIMKLSAVFIPIGIMIIMLGANPRYSEGTRLGIVQKISYKGIFWKTYECEMMLGGAIDGGSKGSVPNLWQFTVVNPDHLTLIKEAMERGDRTQVKYNEWLIGPAWYGTPYIVSDIIFNEE